MHDSNALVESIIFPLRKLLFKDSAKIPVDFDTINIKSVAVIIRVPCYSVEDISGSGRRLGCRV